MNNLSSYASYKSSPILAKMAFLALLSSFIQFTDPSIYDVLMGFIIVYVSARGIAKLPGQKFYLVCTAIYLISNIISFFAIHHLEQATFHFIVSFYLILTPFFIQQVSSNNNSISVDYMMFGFVLAVFSSSIIGALARTGVLPGPNTWYFRDEYATRLSPLFQDPNVYAPYLVLGACISLAFFFRSKGKNTFYLISFATSALVSILALSRAAWLSLAVAGACFAIIYSLKNKSAILNKNVILISVPSVIIGGIAMYLFIENSSLLEYIQSRARIQAYDTDRFDSQRFAFETWLKQPFGVGPGHFISPKNFPESRFPLDPHNLSLKLLAERGFLAFLSFWAILIYCQFNNLIIGLKKYDRSWISVALFCYGMGFIVNSIFIDALHWRHLYIFIAFSLCEISLYRQSNFSQRNSFS